MAYILAKSKRESRKNCKRFLHDNGGEGTSEELDAILSAANSDPDIVREANRIDRERMEQAEIVIRSLNKQLNSMRADIRAAMKARSISLDDLAVLAHSDMHAVLGFMERGEVPSTELIINIAAALQSRWRLG